MTTVRVALIGDHDPAITAHRAIPLALERAAQAAGCAVEAGWIATPVPERDAAGVLGEYDAIWCVPGSPYASMDGALAAIRCARESGVPFLGTCGGFQHALIEYARNVLGLAEADHAESNPAAAMPLIAPLSCSLAEATGAITLGEGTCIRAIYGRAEVTEGFNCNFGVNPRYQELLHDGRLHITGVDSAGAVRVVELDAHPFFIATLFQPERSALRGETHPLIVAFIQAGSGVGG
jgi:CTP synthase (UTP-ammonia lyase)